MDITPLQCRSPSEADLVELVEFRQMEVERLERELGALHTHCDFLVDSFSIPTYPPDDDPVTEPFGVAAVLSEHSNKNGASKTGNEGDTLPSSHGNENDTLPPDNEEVEEVSLAGNMEPVEILSSSSSKGAMDWSRGDDTERPGVKSPANPKISEETGTSSDDNSGFTDEESSSEEVSASSSSEEVSASSSSEEVSASSSSEEVSASSSSESDDIKLVFRSKSRKLKSIFSDSEETSSPSSSASECVPKQQPSLVKIENPNASSSSSDDSEESSSTSSSSSSSSSDDDGTGRNKPHAQAGRPFLRQATLPKVAPTLSLSSDASPEDFFDWMVLGLQGPWLPLTSEHNSSEAKDQSPLPLKFPSMAAYVAMFQKLIGEEARAILLSEWEQYIAAQDSNSLSASQSSLEYAYSEDPRALSSTWQLRSMVQTLGDPFHYLEAEWKAGPKVRFNAGEFVCMIVPGTKEITGVALINNHDRHQAPLLRMRAPWNSSFASCVLMRLCNMVTLRRMFLAVSTVSKIFTPLRQQILDPVTNTKFQKLADDGGDVLELKLCSEALRNFCDRSILNKLQLLTVSCLLQMRQGFQLVQGPPGTGKTSTIVGMVSTLLIEEPGVRILVCAPSNAALDEVAARLVRRMIDKAGNIYCPVLGAIVRFGSRRVMHPLVQMISLDSLSVKLSSRSWADILDAASVVCATLSGCGNSTFDELKKKFDVIIIDEAAQAVEAEVLIALQRARGRCVMVGDPQQLPATVFQRPSTAYGRSLFERFQEGGVPVTMLKNQYRMHPSISRYPSQKFYSGALQNAGRTLSMHSIFAPDAISIRGHTFKLTPYTFIDVNWSTDLLQNHSRANHEEALVVCNTVEAIVKGLNPGVRPDIGVITPYLAQRFLIQDQLGRRGIEAEVNTVDGFQGREKDVVVLSCVRAVADRGVGFVADEKRMNVALTRARFCLVVVGCAATLRRWSPAWDALIEDARARGCLEVLRSLDMSRNRKRSFTRRRDYLEVENKRKRSLDCTDGERPHKRMGYSKPTKAGPERRLQ